MEIQINNKKYSVKEAKTEEEKRIGLLNTSKLEEGEGMLFYYDPPLEVSFWMKGVNYPLDIIFINEDCKVTNVYKGKPNNENSIIVKDVAYVLEVNLDSGIKKGDELEFLDGPVMKVLAQDGSTLMPLWGGERIISRRETRILIKKAKKAQLSEKDSDYKSLGKYVFKVIDKQDRREPEYVLAPT